MGKKIGNITLWLNVHRKDDKDPDFRGKMDIEGDYDRGGETIDISLWINSFIDSFPIHMSGQITEKDNA